MVAETNTSHRIPYTNMSTALTMRVSYLAGLCLLVLASLPVCSLSKATVLPSSYIGTWKGSDKDMWFTMAMHGGPKGQVVGVLFYYWEPSGRSCVYLVKFVEDVDGVGLQLSTTTRLSYSSSSCAQLGFLTLQSVSHDSLFVDYKYYDNIGALGLERRDKGQPGEKKCEQSALDSIISKVKQDRVKKGKRRGRNKKQRKKPTQRSPSP